MWHWLTIGADEKGRSKVEAALLRPLPGSKRVSKGVVDYERSLFAKSLAKWGGGGG